MLQRHGRMTHAELSERVHLSPSACHRRVQRLEQAGVIRDYVALLNPRAVERVTTVFVEIKLSGQSDEILDAFEKAVARVPDVLECHLMAGSADYLLKVVSKGQRGFRAHPSPASRAACRGWRRCSRVFSRSSTVFKTTALPV